MHTFCFHMLIFVHYIHSFKCMLECKSGKNYCMCICHLLLEFNNSILHCLRDLLGLYEVFTWGDNANYTLGHQNIHRKFVVPELVSTLGKPFTINVQQVRFCICCVYSK